MILSRVKLMKNNPVITKDEKLAEDCFSKAISILKGKEKRAKTKAGKCKEFWLFLQIVEVEEEHEARQREGPCNQNQSLAG